MRETLTGAEVAERLRGWPDYLHPMAEAVCRESRRGAWLEHETGAILLGHKPEIAPHCFSIILFPPLPRETVEAYQAIHQISLPSPLLDMLRVLNGCCFFELSIYGIPPSMAQGLPLLDRGRRAPLDIGSGRLWRAGYQGARKADLLFASRNIGDDAQVGYFLAPDERIRGHGNGAREAPADCGIWNDVRDWVASVVEEVRGSESD